MPEERILQQGAGQARRQSSICRPLSRNTGIAALGLIAMLLPMTGCGSFFQCQKASCPTTTPPGSNPTTPTPAGADYAYVANSTAGTTALSEYSITTNALNSLGSIQLGYIPVAMAVSPKDTFLYVASAAGYTSPGIYLYSISSTGTLTVANGGNAVATDTVSSMAISPDGNWLYTVNVDGVTMNEYQVNTSTGGVTLAAPVALAGTPCTLSVSAPVTQGCSVTVAQSGNYVVASLGVSGDYVYPYNSSNGIVGNGTGGSSVELIPSGYSTSNPTGDYSVAVNVNNYALIAQTNSVTAYGLLNNGTIANEGTFSYGSGQAPRSIVLNPAGTFVYTANIVSSTISGFAIGSGGALTQVTGSPTVGPQSVAAIGVDNTGGYLLAVGYDGSAGVQLYSISSAGVLAQVAETGSGTNEAYPALVAMTH